MTEVHAIGGGRKRKALITSGVCFVGFSAAHLIDEFVWGAPQEFHLTVETTLLLALLFVTALTGLLVGAALNRPASIAGLGLAGALIAAADVAKHAIEIAAPGPWRSGTVSVFLAAGLTASAVLTAAFALPALRSACAARSS